MRNIVFFIYPGIKLLDLTGSLQVFADAENYVRSPSAPYRIAVVSPEGGAVQTDTPVTIDSGSVASLRRRAIDTLIVVGGRGVHDACADNAVVGVVAGLSARSRRVVSVCTGAFLLAEAGLLEGKRVVTHWDSCARLAESFPGLSVQKDKIYLRDGSIWTSAGVTAGIDLSLALVQEDWGRAVALAIARRLVAYMVRPGGQSQFSEILELQTATASSRFARLIEWIGENLEADLCVDALAEKAHMSSRSFSRHFRDELGQSPAKFVELARLSAARQLLEESKASVFAVARQCGFNDEERMRRAFLRNLNLSPSEYRSRFN